MRNDGSESGGRRQRLDQRQDIDWVFLGLAMVMGRR